jgi:GDSL-like lipase/acylhydrolase family protein
MSRTHALSRGALLLGAGMAMLACNTDHNLVLPTLADPIFHSYVAIGNSLTAGYQSSGINDSTQKQSFAVLLAKQMGTRFAYPALKMPGCPPPVNNFLAQTRVTLKGDPASTSLTCALRDPASVTAILNNVAVPGIGSADPTADVGPRANALSELVLGGKTMVERALDAQPTFTTVWIGNNDILEPALSGLPGSATPVSEFVANYKAMIDQLVTGAPGLKGVLIAVVQVPIAPLMFPAAALTNPTVIAAASQVAGRPVSLDPTTCSPLTGLGALIDFQYLVAIRARPTGFPGTVFCEPISGGGQSDLGDFLVLDPTEQATVAATINGYNAYIEAKADTIGFAYYDPNPDLLALKNSGAIPVFPNLASAQPFGQYISLDGIHPALPAHKLLANGLIAAINNKYGTSLTPVPIP